MVAPALDDAAGAAFGTNLVFVFATLQEASVAVLSTTVAIQPAPPDHCRAAVRRVAVGSPRGLERRRRVLGAAIVILGAGAGVRASPLGILLAVTALLTFLGVLRAHRCPVRVRMSIRSNGWRVSTCGHSSPPSRRIAVPRPRDELRQFGGMDWLWIVIIAYLTGVTGHVAMSWLHAYLEAARSSLYLLAMHLVAVGLARPIHDEPVTPMASRRRHRAARSVTAVIRLPTRISTPATQGTATSSR
ncbi:MAG: hypothetical protein R2710_25610 [Acidimicrobiales bacterium]